MTYLIVEPWEGDLFLVGTSVLNVLEVQYRVDGIKLERVTDLGLAGMIYLAAKTEEHHRGDDIRYY